MWLLRLWRRARRPVSDAYCLKCVWFSGDLHTVAAQQAALCEKTRKMVHADETCPSFHDAVAPRTARHDLEHVAPILARVVRTLPRRGKVA